MNTLNILNVIHCGRYKLCNGRFHPHTTTVQLSLSIQENRNYCIYSNREEFIVRNQWQNWWKCLRRKREEVWFCLGFNNYRKPIILCLLLKNKSEKEEWSRDQWYRNHRKPIFSLELKAWGGVDYQKIICDTFH